MASADNSESTEIDFVQLRRAEKYESDGKKGVRLYKESDSQYDMFVAKTNRELENNKKYLISMDYKNNSAERIWPQITLMNTDSMEGWGDSGYLGNDLGHLYSESYSDWRRVSFTVDTTGKVDDTHKYLSFAVKGPDGVSKVDYAICNISVQEIDGDFEFAFSSSGHFGYIDDGERQYADYTCPNTFYVGINFRAFGRKKIKIILIFIFFEQFRKTVVISHVEILPVIKPRPFYSLFADIKAKRLNKVQGGVSNSASPCNVACILWNFRF